MSADLAARLLRTGVVPHRRVRDALAASVGDAVPAVLTLTRGDPVEARIVRLELARSSAPIITTVKPDSIAAMLPPGMCARLLALPVRVDARTGTVDVAAADPRDPHVLAEFGFVLQAPIRLLRASLDDLLVSLAELSRAAPRRSVAPPPPPPNLTPAYGIEEADAIPAAPRLPSDPPIPLVRRAPEGFDPDTSPYEGRPPPRRSGTNPGISVPALSTFGQDDQGEPVIGLYRSKPPPPPSRPSADEDVRAGGMLTPDVTTSLDALATATGPDDVVSCLLEGMRGLAPRVAVFVVRSGSFQGRAAAGVDLDAVRNVRVETSKPSVFETAVSAGYYLGPIPSSAAHEGLLEALGVGDDEVYVAPVMVSGHPVMVLVAAGLGDAFSASRWADQLTRAAGHALTRILRGKKHGN